MGLIRGTPTYNKTIESLRKWNFFIDEVRQSLNKVSPPSLVAFGGHKLLMEFILDLMPSVKGSQGNKFFPFLRSSKIDMILKHIDTFFV